MRFSEMGRKLRRTRVGTTGLDQPAPDLPGTVQCFSAALLLVGDLSCYDRALVVLITHGSHGFSVGKCVVRVIERRASS
jgi:hypothetical protein|eukprot:COSAG02_NODE_43_length_45989_cov_93.430181_13_plen_79_part_00